MKLETLMIDNNEQSEEALKHIYTTLVVNEKIKITVDLPELPQEEPPSIDYDELSEEEQEL